MQLKNMPSLKDHHNKAAPGWGVGDDRLAQAFTNRIVIPTAVVLAGQKNRVNLIGPMD